MLELLLLQLLDTPTAPFIIQQAQTALEAKRQQRLDFYQWPDEDKKTEFINGEVVVHFPVLVTGTGRRSLTSLCF
jgi:hypothetical protein